MMNGNTLGSLTLSSKRAESLGLLYGFLGILTFSLTLPASRVAVSTFGAIVVGPGRALISAVFAAILLWLRQEIAPRKEHLPGLALIAVGAIFGFPLLTAWAMNRLPASHGAVELALLPLATAAVSALRNGERPSWLFWTCSIGAAVTVVAYTWVTGLGGVHLADLALLGAVIIVAFAYAEGGRMAHEIGGWQVIAWSVVISLPSVILLLAVNFVVDGTTQVLHASWQAWCGLLYLGIGSQFFGFVAWYTGMALGGVARVIQMQYLQPFFTIVFSWILLGEKLTILTIAATLLVVLWVAIGKQAPIRRQ
ncbi:MAG: DMT family transporter [Alicyclobacillus macrosporangiidus]|uniref:DMT family transporter n=1 Tax=Alicyclobacillus macrosporangiidus TaxID=392015 RepID=UPI0026EFF74D|nr:DMT family transporter [Alicyclobacillus macrosporangiidus]MCL6599696.1 DMT family transporter [Alicyclobacillus macrosporangiidus]